MTAPRPPQPSKLIDWLSRLTPEQRHQHGIQAARMRAGKLRGLPSVFGPIESRSKS